MVERHCRGLREVASKESSRSCLKRAALSEPHKVTAIGQRVLLYREEMRANPITYIPIHVGVFKVRVAI